MPFYKLPKINNEIKNLPFFSPVKMTLFLKGTSKIDLNLIITEKSRFKIGEMFLTLGKLFSFRIVAVVYCLKKKKKKTVLINSVNSQVFLSGKITRSLASCIRLLGLL